jgi:broad specificity phosphatase PhoE
MAIATRLLLLRHGQSTWNLESRWQGWADAPLSGLGEQQAIDAAAHLGGAGFTRVCASDLQRARRTAELIARALGLGEVVTERDLRERNVGAFEGLVMDEIRGRWPESFDPVSGRLIAVPDGESDDDLRARTIPAVIRLAERFSGETLLVVSHGGVIRNLERHLGVDPPPTTPNLGGRWFEVDGGSILAGDALLPVEPELTSSPRSE